MSSCGHSGTPGAFWKDRSQVQEAGSEPPSITCISDLKHASPCYQQEARTLVYSECTQPDGAHAALGSWGLSRPPRTARRRAKEPRSGFSLLHATQTSNTSLHIISKKFGTQPTQEAHSQAKSLPDGGAGDSRRLFGREGGGTRKLEVGNHECTRLRPHPDISILSVCSSGPTDMGK